MAISKVIVNDEIQIDLTNTTADSNRILSSFGAYGANGQWVNGSASSSININILSEELKQALLQMAKKVAYIDDKGQTYYQKLYDALNPKS